MFFFDSTKDPGYDFGLLGSLPFIDHVSVTFVVSLDVHSVVNSCYQVFSSLIIQSINQNVRPTVYFPSLILYKNDRQTGF